MNIILIPEGIRKGSHTSLHHRHVLIIALVGLVIMPVLLSVIGLRIHDMVSRYYGLEEAALLAQQRDQVYRLRAELNRTRTHAETHLNALGQRMGRMQAQVLRLDALGSRITRMAGIDAGEFDFSKAPAMGGPAHSGARGDNNELLNSLEQLAVALDNKSEHLAALESLLLDNQLAAAVTPSGWPVQGGWVSSHFGMRADPFNGRRTYHEGVDMAARLGSTIKAMGDGVVSHSGIKSGYGSMVEITHGQGYTTRYAHTSRNLVKVGDRISKGQPVAEVGSSGRSTGPHLHFEVRRHGRAVDPQQYLVSK